MNIRELALNLISRSPQIQNNPNAQEWINVIKNNDETRGMQIADNICRNYGITREQAINDASSFMNNAFANRNGR